MHLYRFVPTNIESFQAFAWLKPSYLPYAYRGIIAFAAMNLLLLLVVHYLIRRRLEAFANQTGRRFQAVRITG